MAGVRKATKVLAMPIFKKQWLYAVEEVVLDLKPVPSWREGKSITEKAKLGQAQLMQKGHTMLLKQWEDLQRAQPGTWTGTLKNGFYRLARKVLDQEAVTDTFLKTLPAKTDHYQILYPSSEKERYVRRKTRLFLRQQEYYQKCRQILWGVLAVPTIPLFILPFLPNVPMYYAGYKIWCHTRALKGCRQLLRSMQAQPSGAAADPAAATVAAARSLAAEAAAGTATNPPAASDLAAAAPPIESAVDGGAPASPSSQQPFGGGKASGSSSSSGSSGRFGSDFDASRSRQQATYDFAADDDLARAIEPYQQRSEPISQDAGAALGARLGFPSLGRLLQRALGAMQK